MQEGERERGGGRGGSKGRLAELKYYINVHVTLESISKSRTGRNLHSHDVLHIVEWTVSHRAATAGARRGRREKETKKKNNHRTTIGTKVHTVEEMAGGVSGVNNCHLTNINVEANVCVCVSRTRIPMNVRRQRRLQPIINERLYLILLQTICVYMFPIRRDCKRMIIRTFAPSMVWVLGRPAQGRPTAAKQHQTPHQRITKRFVRTNIEHTRNAAVTESKEEPRECERARACKKKANKKNADTCTTDYIKEKSFECDFLPSVLFFDSGSNWVVARSCSPTHCARRATHYWPTPNGHYGSMAQWLMHVAVMHVHGIARRRNACVCMRA